MRMSQRATKLYINLFHHQPNFERPDEAGQYTRLETALREVVHDCKTLVEQHGTGGPQGAVGRGLTTGRQEDSLSH
jgi:hypothetical protein